MLVREIMTSPAFSVHEGAPLGEAVQLMVKSRVTGLPVVDDGNRVVGIISEADLLKADLEPDPRAHMRVSHQPAGPMSTTVGQVMTAHPHTVREDTDVAEVAHTFATTSWKSLPVVRGEVLLGVISRSDVIRMMASSDPEITAEIQRTYLEAGLKGWHVDVTLGVVRITGTGSDRERAGAASIAQSTKGVRRVMPRESGH